MGYPTSRATSHAGEMGRQTLSAVAAGAIAWYSALPHCVSVWH